MTPFARSNRSALGTWFWTIDRVLLVLLFALIALGLVLVMGASGAQVQRLASSKKLVLDDMHFFNRQLMHVALGVVVMVTVSFFTRTMVRRSCALGFVVGLIAIGLTLIIGDDTKGATRWLDFGLMEVQPSEFLKPCFAVVTAWILSARYDDPNAPAFEVSFITLLAVAFLLVLQPDFGQTMLILTVWLAQAILAGLSFAWVGGIAFAALAGLGIAYLFVPHVAGRIDRFLTPENADTYQIDKALDAFRAGGLFGVGPSEGEVKYSIPEAHTDYIFAVAGEEFGLIACGVLAVLYLAIVWRVCKQLLDEDDPFVFLASAGLVAQFGAQAIINMGVNLALLPSKGMTLPFISYGGSSFLALSLSMGLLLALTRRNRFLRASPYIKQRMTG
jgi:cell division protein FtsW